MSFQLPCHGQGHLPLDQVAQSPVQPGLEPCQGGGSRSFSGHGHACFHLPDAILCQPDDRQPNKTLKLPPTLLFALRKELLLNICKTNVSKYSFSAIPPKLPTLVRR